MADFPRQLRFGLENVLADLIFGLSGKRSPKLGRNFRGKKMGLTMKTIRK